MMKARLTEQYLDYPALGVRDLFKFIFQSAFGCEHLVSDEKAALAYIRREAERVPSDALPRTDRLAGRYSRVHLSWLNAGLTPETLTKLFCASAVKEPDGQDRMEELLTAARELILREDIPLDPVQFEEELAKWRAVGFPAIHHSEAYREAYSPAYRVIANRYANLLPLLAKLDALLAQGPVILTVEGGSASGKSTLGEILRLIYDCNVIHMDDFFLRPEQRNSTRLAEAGGNLDRERFSEEVLPCLLHREVITYRPFDCSTQSLRAPVTAEPKPLTVVEGAYSMHPAFGRYYDLSVILDVAPAQQRARIQKRNSPALAKRFFDEWIPMENNYFETFSIREQADLLLPVWED